MKKILAVVAITFVSTVFAGGELKEVCKNKVNTTGQVVRDNSGKVVRVCKTIKIHKKLEGRAVPTKK